MAGDSPGHKISLFQIVFGRRYFPIPFLVPVIIITSDIFSASLRVMSSTSLPTVR